MNFTLKSIYHYILCIMGDTLSIPNILILKKIQVTIVTMTALKMIKEKRITAQREKP